MMYLQKSFTVPAAPERISERCVYGSGQHAPWCQFGLAIKGPGVHSGNGNHADR